MKAFSLLIPFVFLLWCAVSGAAEFGPAAAYTGFIGDELGLPVEDGVHEVKFSFYEEEEGGEPVWTETLRVATTDGYYNAILGGSLPLSLPEDRELWLQVEPDSLPQTDEDSSVPKRRKLIFLVKNGVGTEHIRDKAVTEEKLAPGTLLRLIHNDYKPTATQAQRTEVVLKAVTIPENTVKRSLIITVTGEAFVLEGYLNVYINGQLESTMAVRTSESPWIATRAGFSGTTIVKMGLDWEEAVRIEVKGYINTALTLEMEPPQEVICNSLTVMAD